MARSRAGRRPRRALIVGLTVAGLAICGAAAWALHRGGGEPVAATSTVTVSTGTLRETVTSSGTIQPATQADLSFGASGTVTAVLVAVGDQVAVGQALATIDPTDLSNAVDLATANLAAAEAQLSSSVSAGASSTQTAAARAQVAAAEAKVTSAKASRKAATMTSPIAGTVATVNIAVGTQVGSASGGGGGSVTGSSAASTASSSTAQVVVISTKKWIVNASVNSSDLASLKKGLQAEITPSGARTKVFGTVRSVGVIASSTSGVASFPVTVAVTGSPTGLYAGGSADVTIVVRQLADVLTVPTSAISTEAGQTVVHQVKSGATVSTPVTIGLVSGSTTQVTKGLADGDEIVVADTTSGGARSGSTGTRTGGSGGFVGGTFGGGGIGGTFNGPPGGGP